MPPFPNATPSIMIFFCITHLLLASAFAFTTSPNLPHRHTHTQTNSKTALSMGLTLYGHPGTRSPLCNWAANELGVTLQAGDLHQNPHPFHQLPCLTDDNDVLVFESGAILAYLVQHYGDDKLSKADKASILAWIVWANASLDGICFKETPDGKVYDTALRNASNQKMARLDSILQEQKYCLVPSVGFSVADVAVASYLLYALQFFPDLDMSPWPAVKEYMKQSASRSAYGAAFGAAVQSKLVSALSSDVPPTKKKLFGVL
ncbi:hypothetical protein MPSEU_000417200 [Mayamaea pseudoterrestris]|nr:hypothetical protein MPSEU_000417200 [Mayamaea pseudoterrestris]